jgi:flagellar L-ring protein precursor FlgH
MMAQIRSALGKILVVPFIFFGVGCASMQDMISYFDGSDKPKLVEDGKPVPRYSENPSMGVPTDRQYKRMTRSRLEEESELGASAGSAWVMEGQGAYLFVQNKSRKEGDLLNVKLDNSALKQVETKVTVIKKLLKQLEEQELNATLAQQSADTRAPASEGKKEAPKADAKEDKQDLTEVQNVPTRIVEKLADGNYRVKGQQPFMIGKRDYKVIVTGLIRPEDFNDQGISSDKLLDPQYDVVNIRKNKSNE